MNIWQRNDMKFDHDQTLDGGGVVQFYCVQSKDQGRGDIHAHHGTCTGELSGSVFRGYGFSRDQAFGGSSQPGSIGLSEFTRLFRVLLPKRQSENSEA